MQYNQPIITKSAEETKFLGRQLAASLLEQKRGERAPTIICLYGQLGSGKTTFAQGFAQGLGITNRLLSPTFIIVRRYQLSDDTSFLYHLDLYRLKTSKDIEGLGLWEIFQDPDSYVLIEWAEKLTELLPERRIDIWFNTLSDDKHRITMKII